MKLEIYIPDMYKKSIYDIDYNALLEKGIKCILFDLDNTMAPIHIKEPDTTLRNLFADIELMGFKVIILSNSKKERVRPFKEKLNVDASFHSHKPFKKKYKKIMSLYHFNENEIACIGDQLLTDIKGANRMNFFSILVNPVSKIDLFGTKINRIFERRIFKKLERQGMFKVGEYYE